jgi:hypothetical protein
MERNRRRRVGIVVVPLLWLACGVSAAPGDGPAEPEVASIRLYDERGADLTAHIPLPATQPLRIEVRLFAFNGNRILGLAGGQEITFLFTPPSLATSTAVSGEALTREVRAMSPSQAAGTLHVLLRRLRDGAEKQFGPFDVLVH